MIIGIPKEIKNNENRVALTPAGARELVKRGHKVYVQATAGVNSGFADEAYTAVGAEILPTIGDVYARAEMIVKVKEPVAPEYKLIRRDQLVFTFFHFASSEPLTRAMVDSGAVCCAYETVERADRSLPLLIPMSEVAGRMATQEGRYFLENPRGGKGVLVGAGAALATEPIACLVLLVIFLVEVAITHIVSLGSIIIAALYPVLTLCYWLWKGADAASLVFITVCCVLMGAYVIWLHRSNIQRLKNGTEYRFGEKKKENQ